LLQGDGGRRTGRHEGMKPRIKYLHQRVDRVWPKDKDTIPLERVDCGLLADMYYHAWMPEGHPVKLMIIAESHASTDLKALGLKFEQTIEESDMLNDLNLGHLNLVHSLSYGEPWLLNENSLRGIDGKLGIEQGTIQFWRFFFALAGYLNCKEGEQDPLQVDYESATSFSQLFSSIEGKSSDDPQKRRERLQTKLAIRSELRKRGILLVDMCPFPIYAGGSTEKRENKKTGNVYTTRKNKLTAVACGEIIRASWDFCTKFQVQHFKPDKVLLLGKNIENAIGKEKFQEEIEGFGSSYLGSVHHPSYNRLLGRNFIPMLQFYRKLGTAIDEGSPVSMISSKQPGQKGKEAEPSSLLLVGETFSL
jgi:hypothetical protein